MATVKYRILHFVADPIAATRVTVAVLVAQSSGVEVVMAQVPENLSARSSNAIRLMRPAVQRLESFDELPTVFGPQFQLGAPAETPGSDDPIAWIRWALGPND